VGVECKDCAFFVRCIAKSTYMTFIVSLQFIFRSVCHGYLALKELGRAITEENTRIYDGSWKEWGKEDNLPKILPDEMN